LLLTLTAFSIDILLPAFSLIATDLDASYYKVELLIPTFLAAVGIGQLVGGSLSDRFGRRAVIKAGLCIYILGVIVSVFATNIDTVLAGRILQGLGGSAGPVVARSIIRDLYSGKELARNMALAVAVFAFGPIVAPLAGAALLLIFDWRALFVMMLIFAASLLAFCVFFLPETIHEKNPLATRVSIFVQNTVTIFTQSQSRFYLLLSGVMMSMIMIILINLPAIYQLNFGITGTLFAILFAIHGFGIIIGQLINRRLIETIGIERTATMGAGSLLIISLVIAAISLAGMMGPWLLAGLLVIHATSYLVVYANAAALTLDPHGKIAGFTSSFYGFFSQVVSSIIGALLAIFVQGNLIIWSLMLLGFAIITFSALLWRQSRSADKNSPEPGKKS